MAIILEWALIYVMGGIVQEEISVFKLTTRTKPIVIPTEIQNLKDLEAYIKLPGNYPLTKLKMNYQPLPQGRTKPFDITLSQGAAT